MKGDFEKQNFYLKLNLNLKLSVKVQQENILGFTDKTVSIIIVQPCL